MNLHSNLDTLIVNSSKILNETYNMNASDTGVFILNRSNTLINSTIEELIPAVKHPLHVVVIFAIFYSVIFLFALFGNIVVVVVVWKHRWMHTVTNFFIVNLAVADVLVAIFCIPITFLTNIYTGKIMSLNFDLIIIFM